jgi:hypothetical protein
VTLQTLSKGRGIGRDVDGVNGKIRRCTELAKPVRDEKIDGEIGQGVKKPLIPLTVPRIHQGCSVGVHLKGRA